MGYEKRQGSDHGWLSQEKSPSWIFNDLVIQGPSGPGIGFLQIQCHGISCAHGPAKCSSLRRPEKGDPEDGREGTPTFRQLRSGVEYLLGPGPEARHPGFGPWGQTCCVGLGTLLYLSGPKVIL